MERSVDLTPFGAGRDSARNLLHYLAFRSFDLREEQARLAHWGLSSLGRSESHVLYNLDAVLGWLHRLGGGTLEENPSVSPVDPARGQELLAQNADRLLGRGRPGRRVRIMVTLPSEAAQDGKLARELLEGGMDCARINCAHDGPPAWAKMVDHIRAAERRTGIACRIEMDLAGPKIRTGPIVPGPRVVKIRPERDELGKVTAPAVAWLVPPGGTPPVGRPGPGIPVSPAWLSRRRPGDHIDLRDARGAHRSGTIVERSGVCCGLELGKTVYLVPGTPLTAAGKGRVEDATTVGPVPARERKVTLRRGERLIVHASPELGEPAVRAPGGRVLEPGHIACTLPEGLAFVRKGQSIWFDDGKIGGVVRAANAERLVVEVTHTPTEWAGLGADKGINLPETSLDLPGLSPKDLEDLQFVAKRADLVGMSFVQSGSDVDRLRRELARLQRPQMGMILKVETRRGFDELPAILLAAVRQPPAGVMIARGDLAVEVGFERLSEVQEEMLWLCEAAHLPAVWATQVLEGLAKSGLPSRAEVTDAAMGERSECVMLNKGPHIVEAVRALDSILRRMESHQTKKTAMLRHLGVVDQFLGENRFAAPATFR